MTATPDDLLREELDNARRASAESRSAITKKLGMLEVRVQETVTDVKQAFDFDYQMQQRPWLMVGGSVLVGYTLARLVNARQSTSTFQSADFDAPPRQQHDASTKGAVLDVVTGTLWAMAMKLFSPDIPVYGADAGRPEPPATPPMTDPGEEAGTRWPSHVGISEMS